MNSLAIFSMYEHCESQRDRLGRSRNMCMPRNHFNSPNSFIMNFFFRDEIAWVGLSVSCFCGLRSAFRVCGLRSASCVCLLRFAHPSAVCLTASLKNLVGKRVQLVFILATIANRVRREVVASVV